MRRLARFAGALPVFFLLTTTGTALALPGATSASDDDDDEQFLREADVVAIKPLGKGVTGSQVVTLSNGSRTAKAVRKVIDEYEAIKRFDDGGPPELGFRDSFDGEIAAYKLDRLIGLHQVPPTVERSIRGKQGSLQLWVDDCITEGERRRRDMQPPDPTAWNRQIRAAKLFFQLIHDVDFANLSNLLVDPAFRLHKVDSSRAFRTRKTILEEAAPGKYSRALLDGLRRLDEPTLKREIGAWLSKQQRSSLLARRDQILERAASLAAELGEDAIFYP